MLAISLAVAMTFGMTAFAADSVNTSTEDVSDVVEVEEAAVTTVVTVAVEEVKVEDLSEEEVASIQEESTQKAAAVKAPALSETKTTSTGEEVAVTKSELTVEQAAQVPNATKAVVEELVKQGAITLASGKSATEATTVKAYFDIDLATVAADGSSAALSSSEKNGVIGSGITLSFKVDAPKAGKTVVVLHQKTDGSWESVPSKLSADGTLVATFSSLSPVIITEVDVDTTTTTTDDKDDDDDDDDTVAATTTAATAQSGKSPKTAETASAAGVIALAAVAAAVVASKKIRYNA
jgi:hypothetical protein